MGNMRGSGVHGGLLVYESRFTAELLATLLSIPQSKTLLRRHLATHFNQLLGRDIVQAKRDMETSPTHPSLNPVSKVKILKKSQFTLKRKKGKPDEFDPEDWVCPDFEIHDFNSDKNVCRKVKNIIFLSLSLSFSISLSLAYLICIAVKSITSFTSMNVPFDVLIVLLIYHTHLSLFRIKQ